MPGKMFPILCDIAGTGPGKIHEITLGLSEPFIIIFCVSVAYHDGWHIINSI